MCFTIWYRSSHLLITAGGPNLPSWGRVFHLCRKSYFFVVGFNLYHALNYKEFSPNYFRFRKYKWLNLYKFASLFVGPLDSLEQVLLFTAFVTWDRQKVVRHKLFIRANESEGHLPAKTDWRNHSDWQILKRYAEERRLSFSDEGISPEFKPFSKSRPAGGRSSSGVPCELALSECGRRVCKIIPWWLA
jgi:hypothetical protein